MSSDSLSAVSFRDPAGFVYLHEGDLRRQVNSVYRAHYDRLFTSGLYDELVRHRLLVAHEELEADPSAPPLAYKVIRPERVDFISYPYEWCFSQYQDAAMLALEVERRALARGMTLKDSSAYNVQFRAGRPILIDTLSFEIHKEGEPWGGYRQFCEHFLAPLALMSLVDHRLNQLCRANIDGIPLDLAARLLPRRTHLRFGLNLHVHLHALLQRSRSAAKDATEAARGRVSTTARLGLIDSLSATVSRLKWRPRNLGWASYYKESPYSPEEFHRKTRLVAEFLDRIGPRRVWDLGANTGAFSELASSRGFPTISLDFDPACVERIYLQAKQRHETNLLPLLLDFLNPSPPSGWLNQERASIFERGKPDLVLALALIHHLAFSGNQPLENLAEFFDRLTPWLVIEFVPETDPEVIALRARRRGIHHAFDRDHFEKCFGRHFTMILAEPLSEGGRIVYLMRRREAVSS
jgi:hypothetical protein